jgi:hypothetical protein
MLPDASLRWKRSSARSYLTERSRMGSRRNARPAMSDVGEVALVGAGTAQAPTRLIEPKKIHLGPCWVKSRHLAAQSVCPLYPRKRTLRWLPAPLRAHAEGKTALLMLLNSV